MQKSPGIHAAPEQSQVISDAARKEYDRLIHGSHRPIELLPGILLQRDIIQQDLSGPRSIQSGSDSRDRAFPGTGRPDQSDSASRAQRK